jgi:hypothetical protein
MQRNGIGDNFARKQMRHQTIRQTDGYTDEAQLPIYDSIKNLPRLENYTQIRAQIYTRTDFSRRGSKRGASCLGWALLDGEKEMERAKGFEPSTSTLARWCSTN